MPFHRLYYHLIWTTYRREPMITEQIEKLVFGTILNKAEEIGCPIYAIGGIDNHIHVATSIPPKLAVAEIIRQFKGASAYYVNHQPVLDEVFRWQQGYGALTFGGGSMETVVAYVRNQKQHHNQETTIAIYERWDTEN